MLHGFVKVVLCISRPLPNKPKLKFSKFVAVSALNESTQCLGPVVPFAMFLVKILDNLFERSKIQGEDFNQGERAGLLTFQLSFEPALSHSPLLHF